ncbi:AFG1/ZapE family ATPase [Frankia sp. Cas3]|uniref:AFG1/ZapE family ATPase n=1 Tax=Frankia sp. Cas3 TaxID=3073926 RepID=UPI002AD45300|nr:AFG1/ZapE family ATPase [Frankia sp. Cas3]
MSGRQCTSAFHSSHREPDRGLPALAVRDDHTWFNVGDLCEGPVSALDVLALTDRFTVWVVEGLRRMTACSPDAQQRFVNLVDVLCDRDIALFRIGDIPLADLLCGAELCGADTAFDPMECSGSSIKDHLVLASEVLGFWQK